MLDDRRKTIDERLEAKGVRLETRDERFCVIASPRSLSEVEVRAWQSLTRILSSWRSVAVLERSDRIRSIYFILALVLAFLLTACTDYYQQFEDEYAFGKTSGRFVFDGQTLTDLRNDQTYEVVKVGNLYWMNRNLGFEFYHSHNNATNVHCPNSSVETCEKTGFLYPGTRVDNLCIDGWRLPSVEEWEEYYNSSAYQGSTYGKDSYKGYLGGDESLNEYGKAAYFWVDSETDGLGNRKCIVVTPESNSFRQVGPCHEQEKLAVRCVLDVDKANVTPSSSSSASKKSSSSKGKQNYECSVTDGVIVFSPSGGETFSVGEKIKVVYGSDVKGSGFRFVFMKSEGDAGQDLLSEVAGPQNPDGKTCYEQEVVLDKDIVGSATSGIIRVVPYEKSNKGAHSRTFNIQQSSTAKSSSSSKTSSSKSSSSKSSSSKSSSSTKMSSSVSNDGIKGVYHDSRDKQDYETLTVGDDVWMTSNLLYEAEGSYCYNNDNNRCREYGRLYSWDVAMKACPNGWRLPTTEEWKMLFYSELGADLASSMDGAVCDVVNKKGSGYLANITVSVKPSAYQDSRCTTSSNWKDCGALFIKVTNNDNVDYKDLELHFYLDVRSDADETPVSYISFAVSGDGAVVGWDPPSFGKYIADNEGKFYLPIFLKRVPASGYMIFQAFWTMETFASFGHGWSIDKHPANDGVAAFSGIDLTQAPYFTGSETQETEKDSKGNTVKAYTEDPYIPVYMNGKLVSGFAPDGTSGLQEIPLECSEVTYDIPVFWTSREDGGDAAYGMAPSEGPDEGFLSIMKTKFALPVRCVQK